MVNIAHCLPPLFLTNTGMTYIYHHVHKQMASMANTKTLPSHLNKEHFPVLSAYDASVYAYYTMHLQVLFSQQSLFSKWFMMHLG